MNDRIINFSFCDDYIAQLTEFMLKRYASYDNDLRRIAVVFGGRRPALFLKSALAKKFRSNFFPPTILRIDDLVGIIAGKEQDKALVQDMDAAYILYGLAKQHTPELLAGRVSFAEFLPWAKEIIAFLDQLDLEDIDNKLLADVALNAEVGFDVPEDINALLKYLSTLRILYCQTLSAQGLFSRGMLYKQAAENAGSAVLDKWDEIIFANFFYFNASELKVAKTLVDCKKAVMAFQGDSRKWSVLDKLSKHFGAPIIEGKEIDKPKFDLKIYEAFDVHSQVGLVRKILSEVKDLERTVVVLPQPDHIIPLLSDVAGSIKDFNISLGYPLKRSSVFSLFESIFECQISKKDGRYHAKNYLKLLMHPFIKNLELSQGASVTRILIHKIEEVLTGQIPADISGKLFINLEDILRANEIFDSACRSTADQENVSLNLELKKDLALIHEVFFTEWGEIKTFHALALQIKRVLDVLTEKSFLRNYPLNINIVNRLSDMADKFLQAQFKHEEFTIEEIFKLFTSGVEHEIVAFIGSPLKGLQILGLFETRSLNFDNVIVMDANEGVLPRLELRSNLIPREVMLALKLDRLDMEEEIQRYQFMRLISSAKTVHLVYQHNNAKERSRFVEELLWEDQKKFKKLAALPVVKAGFKVSALRDIRRVKKTPEVIELLRGFKFSSSSVNTYLRNPMDFYYQYILGLREKEDMLDEIEAKEVGTFFHELLEEAFKPFLGKKPLIDRAFMETFERIAQEKFDVYFGKAGKSENFLLKTVIDERVKRFLENERSSEDRKVAKVLYLEQRFTDEIHLPGGKVFFNYVFDRIDEMEDGSIMILDYKTGSTDKVPKTFENLAEAELSREFLKKHIGSFQLPLYFYYLSRKYPGKKLNAALYSLRTLGLTYFIKDKMMDISYEAINQVYLKALDFIINEIKNPEVDFIEEED
ncbi:MAG: PD-(D/E)XK nuclease family protein [Candidatus Omnitrophica bacterium]|nr:PD-(D/E)XK nuclease family protein [Candidatus Omnitrophota bacterium]